MISFVMMHKTSHLCDQFFISNQKVTVHAKNAMLKTNLIWLNWHKLISELFSGENPGKEHFILKVK